jgi:predicted ATP-binding protein involved in virulence
MLILAQLVYLLDEKFLVLIDEPECHLHPPLLASFIQCLSYLLRERNAIAIIATHSPVVLQEVAKDSVWILDRTEHEIAARRPSIETFGEGLGVLLNEIFGVEMRSSGYHALIKEAVEEGSRSYDEIVNYFEDHLGMEARAILRILLAERGRL